MGPKLKAENSKFFAKKEKRKKDTKIKRTNNIGRWALTSPVVESGHHPLEILKNDVTDADYTIALAILAPDGNEVG